MLKTIIRKIMKSIAIFYIALSVLTVHTNGLLFSHQMQNLISLQSDWIRGSPLINIGSLNLKQLSYYPIIPLAKYDFIIVGSGPAGCVLANRLSENPNFSVLLLEVGNPEIPFTSDVPLAAPNLQSTPFNWGYLTEVQDKACLSMEGKRCHWPHGKVLGGSSVINYMIYTRGNRRDYDNWSLSGNLGWSFDEVLPYFMKSENATIRDFHNNGLHGHDGPLPVEDNPYRSPIVKAFVQASQEAGYNYIDYNSGEQIGVSYLQQNTRNGRRISAVSAFLEPVKKRTNLHISVASRVTKLLLNQAGDKVNGVFVVINGRQYFVKSKKEVILSAGSFESPKLLMLSGIGPAHHLNELGIKVVKNLPVGKILYEHMAVWGPIFTVSNDMDGNINLDKIMKEGALINWFYGQGPFTINGVEGLVYMKTNVSDHPDPGLPDIEMMQAFASLAFDTGTGTRRGLRFTERTYQAVLKPIENQRAFLFLPMLLHPKSVGFLKLKSNNPYDNPLFYPNYFDDYRDLDTLVAAMKEAIRITSQKSFQPLGLKLYQPDIPGCEYADKRTDDYWRCYVMHLSATLHHQVATCKMGPVCDPTSVVDNELRVHGFKNLRVVDTSIIPQPPSGHTSALSFMIGEKAADMIKDAWELNNDFASYVEERFIRSHRRRRSAKHKFDWQKVSSDENYSASNTKKSDDGKKSYERTKVAPQKVKNTSKENDNVFNIKEILRASEDDPKPKHSSFVTESTAALFSSSPQTSTDSTSEKSAIELIMEKMPSADEDAIRTYTLENWTVYGRGHAKPKYITAALAEMNTTEYNENDFKQNKENASKEINKMIIKESVVMTRTSMSVSKSKSESTVTENPDQVTTVKERHDGIVKRDKRFIDFWDKKELKEDITEMRRFVSNRWKDVSEFFRSFIDPDTDNKSK